MRHFASSKFWEAYRRLPDQVRLLADKNYELLKQNPQHLSLQLKKAGRFGPFGLDCAIALSRQKQMAIWSGSGSARTPITTR